MKYRRQGGLSLLELLVVFVIISMVSTVLLQGFGYGLSLYERVESRGQRIVVDSLSAKWFRRVNGALVPSKSAGESLVGDNQDFSVVSLNPLVGTAGIATPVRWELAKGVLVYREASSELALRRLSENARFQYRSRRGDWLDRWPINPESHDLPSAVRIWSEGGPTITANIKGRLYPDLLLEESRRERQ